MLWQAGDVLFIPAFWGHANLNLKVGSILHMRAIQRYSLLTCDGHSQPGISVSGEFDPAGGFAGYSV